MALTRSLASWSPCSAEGMVLKSQLERYEPFGVRQIEHTVDDIRGAMATLDLDGPLGRPPWKRIRLSWQRMTGEGSPSQIALVDSSHQLLDLDEALLDNERFVRAQRKEYPSKGCRLMTLSDFLRDVASLTRIEPQTGVVTLTRQTPPNGGLELLDQLRPIDLKFHGTDASFAGTFDRITQGILRGLDWSNVIVAGGSVLTTLLHVDQARDYDFGLVRPDIDIYLYGLSVEEANTKMEHIYKVWERNLPAYSPRLVIKSARTIEYVAEYPSRRIQIILKLQPQPIDVLLKFDLDVCAVLFDGNGLLMLPRCARALETGYNVFTMDLIWGHPLAARRESRLQRILKYANRGFGIRVLPSYARFLGKSLDAQPSPTEDRDDDMDSSLSLDIGEPGLKILRRIVRCGKNFVDRHMCSVDPSNSRELYCSLTVRRLDQLRPYNAYCRLDERERIGHNIPPFMQLWRLAHEADHEGPGSIHGKGLCNFEIFARCCEAWRFAQQGLVILEPEVTGPDYGTIPESEANYGTAPTYTWDLSYRREYAVRGIEVLNCTLRSELMMQIEEAPPYLSLTEEQLLAYATYEARSQVYGSDLGCAQVQPIALPVWITADHEADLRSLLHQMADVPPRVKELSNHLVPVQDHASSHILAKDLPHLVDSADSAHSFNLRFWRIDESNMWAGQHPILDEVFEILWSCFKLFRSRIADHGSAMLHLRRVYDKRNALPNVPDRHEGHMARLLSKLPSHRESLLFQSWVLPVFPDIRPTLVYGREAFIPEHLFWRQGDEGSWGKPGVPLWQRSGTEEQGQDKAIRIGGVAVDTAGLRMGSESTLVETSVDQGRVSGRSTQRAVISYH